MGFQQVIGCSDYGLQERLRDSRHLFLVQYNALNAVLNENSAPTFRTWPIWVENALFSDWIHEQVRFQATLLPCQNIAAWKVHACGQHSKWVFDS